MSTPMFQDKLNERITQAMNTWWGELSKDEILDYLRSQPQITADYLRTMLSNEGISIQLGTVFDCNNQASSTTL